MTDPPDTPVGKVLTPNPDRQLLCVSLAPSLDRYAWLPSVRIGSINRPNTVVARAGGKGLNVASTAVGLGVSTRAVVLAGGETGRTIRALAGAEALSVTWIDSGAETRQCLCLLDESTSTLTEIYEPVQPVAATLWPRIRAAVEREVSVMTSRDLLALSGRVPPGLPDEALADLVDIAASFGIPVIVDSDGPALGAVLRRGPTMVKVNQHEATAAAGTAHGVDEGWAIAAALQRMGARSVVVTAGAHGSIYLGADGHRVLVEHDPIAKALPVGSGDAFLAGLSAAWLAGPATNPQGMEMALRMASSAARANARQFMAGDISWAQLQAEMPAVRVRSA